MPYSIVLEKEEAAKAGCAFGKEVNVSPKHAGQVCAAVRGMRVNKALVYLKDVQAKKKFVKFHQHAKKMPCRRGGVRGRYPIKAAKIVAGLIRDAKANAEHKGLDGEKLAVIHASAYKTLTLPRIRPHGRGGHGIMRMGLAHNIDLTNIEIVVREK